MDGERFVNALSRRLVIHQLSQAFCRELFYSKPIRRLLGVWTVAPLEIPDGTGIAEAVNHAIARAPELRYEPVIAVAADGTRVMLDLYALLHAQCDVLAATVGDLERERLARQAAEGEREQLYQRLINASRQAGIAQVATSVLHNVGNVLNSVNVSATLVADKLKQSKLGNLGKTVALLEEHSQDLGAFLTGDQRGAQVLGYLGKLSVVLAGEREQIEHEVDELGRSVEHIKQIVVAQQNFAKWTVAVQPFEARDVMEDAVRINSLSLERHKVVVERRYETVPPVVTDKHLVMQVLVNLVSNAKQAVRDSGNAERRIVLSIDQARGEGGAAVRFKVSDNGVGIVPENLNKIFQHGFTTRAEGHGFGLHTSANTAQQLHGRLSAQSDGPGLGATFILELPLQYTSPEGPTCATPTQKSAPASSSSTTPSPSTAISARP
jgi:signal transduction histidine kinase